MESNIHKTKTKKITALKNAANELISFLEKQNPEGKYIRTGAVSYQYKIMDDTPPSWKLDGMKNLVKNLSPSGGTNISSAMKAAYKEMHARTEISKHKKENGTEPNLAIVLMTDGKNSQQEYDAKTLKACDAIKKEGIKIYSIAFAALKKGKKLLSRCASSESRYYEANDMEKLILAYRHIGVSVPGKENLALYE